MQLVLRMFNIYQPSFVRHASCRSGELPRSYSPCLLYLYYLPYDQRSDFSSLRHDQYALVHLCYVPGSSEYMLDSICCFSSCIHFHRLAVSVMFCEHDSYAWIACDSTFSFLDLLTISGSTRCHVACLPSSLHALVIRAGSLDARSSLGEEVAMRGADQYVCCSRIRLTRIA